MPVKPIPDGYHSLTPYLIVRGAAEAIDYYREVFGAVELYRMPGPDGRVGHAEIRIGDSRMMLADEHPEFLIHAPRPPERPPVSLLLYVDDVDTVFTRAVTAGCTVLRPLADQFYGDRSGTFTDPFGHVWTIATHKEDLTAEEVMRRAKPPGEPSE
jgi:PhnB protein